MIAIAKLIDKMIIFLCAVTMLIDMQNIFIPVITAIAGITFSVTGQILDRKKIKIAVLCIYMAITLMFPNFAIMLPLVFYEIMETQNIFLICTGLAAGAVSFRSYEMKEIVFITALMAISAMFQVKMRKNAVLSEELIETRDTGTEKNYILESRNRDLIESQNYEVHLATLKERNRIAREIHDNVGHLLTRSILQLGAMLAINKDENEKIMLEGVKDTLDSAMTSIRESVHNLHDESIDFTQAINECLNPMREKYRIRSAVEISPDTEANIKICLITIVKEAMSNILKHSNCTAIEIFIQEHPAFYKLVIHDNGTCGEVKNSGMGLAGMTERVERLNGIIRITSENGFEIFVTIPKMKGHKNENSNS